MKTQQPKPNVGQESVWDYPRPPRVEETHKYIQVFFNGVSIATTCAAKRILETSHPPVYYIPLVDTRFECFFPTEKSSFCEFKGIARYFTIRVQGREALEAAWHYPNPRQPYAAIKDCVAFYPSRMEACYVDGERVQAQEGDFYGGWITSDIVGPFKGGPGTMGW